MRTMGALLSTEATKLKRTATLWLSVIVPMMFLALLFIGLLNEYAHQRGLRMSRSLLDEWNNVLRGPWTLWTLVALPILIAVEAAGLSSPEHAGKHWTQIFALPIPRWNVFAAKAIVCGLLTGVSSLVFTGGVVVLSLLRSGLFHLHLASGIPWSLVVQITARTYLASWCVICVQTWLSVRFTGFAIPIGTALAATLFGGVAAQLGVTGWYPWTMSADSLPWGWSHTPASAMISPVLCLAVALLANWHLSRREIV
jgi:lantibiotic transport system permease protein